MCSAPCIAVIERICYSIKPDRWLLCLIAVEGFYNEPAVSLPSYLSFLQEDAESSPAASVVSILRIGEPDSWSPDITTIQHEPGPSRIPSLGSIYLKSCKCAVRATRGHFAVHVSIAELSIVGKQGLEGLEDGGIPVPKAACWYLDGPEKVTISSPFSVYLLLGMLKL